jgi:hypothetical protein
MPATRLLELTYLRPDASAKPTSTALVPVVAATQWAPPAGHPPSPDPTFVTQLIANAERLAERRRWPRDRAADASFAYRADRRPVYGAKTRQMI